MCIRGHAEKSSRQHCPSCQEARRRRWSLLTNCTQGQTLSCNEVVPIHIITFLPQVMPRPELLPKASVYEDLFWLLQLFSDVPPSTQTLHKAISVQWPLYLHRKLPAKLTFTSESSSEKKTSYKTCVEVRVICLENHRALSKLDCGIN